LFVQQIIQPEEDPMNTAEYTEVMPSNEPVRYAIRWADVLCSGFVLVVAASTIFMAIQR